MRSRPHAGRARGESGETLVELLCAMGILAVAIVTIVASMGVAINLSTRHRQQAQAATYLVQAAEAVKGAAYVPCDASPTYSSDVTPPAGWTVTVGNVASMQDGNTDTPGPPVACPSADTGLQQVTVSVSTPTDYHVDATVVKRNIAP